MNQQDTTTYLETPPSLDDVARRVNEISTLPHIALKVMEVANNPKSSALDMKVLIETDPALSARVLRYVNSSACAPRERISNLQQAITLIGLRQIRSLVMTASVGELFNSEEEIGTFQRRRLWKHLVAVGICARLIAMRQRVADFEDAFVAGLLHDIGIVLEDQYVHAHFCQVMHQLDDQLTLVETERNWLGFDHARLGARIAESWRFPEVVKAAIAFHHMSDKYRGDHLLIVQCVEIANLLCTLKGMSSVGRKLVRVPQAAMNALALTREHISVLANDLDDELARNAALFDL